MAKSDYLHSNDGAFRDQMNRFKDNLGAYAATLGVTPAQLTAQRADADYFDYALTCQERMQAHAQQWTTWKDLARDGGTPPATGTPVAPALPEAVSAVPLGIEARFRALVKQLKASTGYNASLGQALGIEAPDSAPVDVNTLQPEIDPRLTGNRIEIGWGWGGHRSDLDLIELQVDRSDGKGFILLAYDTTPGYVDTAPLPATPTKWKYKAIYRLADQQVGQWSDEAGVTVGG